MALSFAKLIFGPPTALTDLALIGEKNYVQLDLMHGGELRAASHIEPPRLVTLEPLLSQSVPGPTCVLTAHTFSDFIPFLSSDRSPASTFKLTDKSSPRLCWFPVKSSHEDPPEKDLETCTPSMEASLELATSWS